ncbi:hypothetical protein XarbCFBP7610_11945 [Xanthomonas arboricola]|nr:hypothetical protein XarbCFBP7610_11945 [Xanthomonas arboricola]
MASPHQPPTIAAPFVGACLRATRALPIKPRRAQARSYVDVVHRSSTVTAPSLPRRRPARKRPIAYKSYADGTASPTNHPPSLRRS